MSLAYAERRRLLDRDLAAHTAMIHGVVLEIGAGQVRRRGRFVLPVERIEGWWSLDIAPGVRPHVVGDVEALPLRCASVDTVLSLAVLEYVMHPQGALAEIHRVLCPAGYLILSVPFIHRIDGCSDRWRFSKHALLEVLRVAGFVVVSLRAQGCALSAAAHLLGSVVAQRRWGIERWLLGALALPLLAIARLETHFAHADGTLATATTGYLVVGRK